MCTCGFASCYKMITVLRLAEQDNQFFAWVLHVLFPCVFMGSYYDMYHILVCPSDFINSFLYR